MLSVASHLSQTYQQTVPQTRSRHRKAFVTKSVVGPWKRQCSISRRAQKATISRGLGYLHAAADPYSNIPWSRILPRKTSEACRRNVEICTSAACVQRLACRAISACAELLVTWLAQFSDTLSTSSAAYFWRRCCTCSSSVVVWSSLLSLLRFDLQSKELKPADKLLLPCTSLFFLLPTDHTC